MKELFRVFAVVVEASRPPFVDYAVTHSGLIRGLDCLVSGTGLERTLLLRDEDQVYRFVAMALRRIASGEVRRLHIFRPTLMDLRRFIQEAEESEVKTFFCQGLGLETEIMVGEIEGGQIYILRPAQGDERAEYERHGKAVRRRGSNRVILRIATDAKYDAINFSRFGERLT